MQLDPSFTGKRTKELDAYEVARLVVEKCLSANRVAAVLYPDEYSNPRTKSRAIMRVKYLLRYAVETGILSITPPRSSLADALTACPEFQGVQFEVVSDVGYGLDPAEPVYREAARLVSQRIHELLEKQERVVVANAGGWGLSRLVEHLPAVIFNYENAKNRLSFVSLNALGGAGSYHLSANFVAVRMATIFGGKHLAVVQPAHVDAEYRRVVGATDLLLCGAGSKGAFLNQWLANEQRRHPRRTDELAVALPPGAVGDVCLIPIDEWGNQVPLGSAIARRVRQSISPRPGYSALHRLAAKNKVMLVAAAPIVEGIAADPRASLKVPVVRAILRASLARWCVLGSSFARQLSEAVRAPITQP